MDDPVISTSYSRDDTTDCLYCSNGETASKWPDGAAGIVMRALVIDTHELDCAYADGLRYEIHDLLTERDVDPSRMVDICIRICQQEAQA